jgi:hypothetical protein
MRFEHPIFLFALILLLVPILIHLFSFRRYKTFYFSSIYFLKNIEEETKNVRKLKHLLVLISRLLAFTALIFTFAQPYLPIKGSSKHKNSVLAIYIDNSFSMSTIGANGSLLSESKEQAKKIIENASDNVRVLLVTNGLTGIEQQLCSKSEAFNRLDKIQISSLSHPLSEVIQWMEESVNENTPNSYAKQFVLLTDFQKNQSDLKNIHLDKSIYFYPIQLVPEQKNNVSIDSIWFNNPNFKTKINNELNIHLTNHGDEIVSNLELQLAVNETKRTVFVSIPKHSKKEIVLNYSDLTNGDKTGHVHITDKNVHFDDDFYFSYNVASNANILLIQGEDADSKIANTYKLDSYYIVNELSSTSFIPASTIDKQLIVLNGVNVLNDGINDAIYKFTQNGGSILLFPGTQIHKQSWNNLLQKLNLPQIAQVSSTKLNLSSITYSDPFFQGIFDKNPKKINLPILQKIYQTRPNVYSIPLLNLQHNIPLFVRNNNNYLFTSALDSTFSAFTSNALFPSCLLRTAELSQKKSELYLTIGSNNRLPWYEAVSSDNLFHIEGEGIDFIPIVEKIDQITYISLLNPSLRQELRQGVYKLTNSNLSKVLPLNYSRVESNIATFTEDEIKSYLNTKKFPKLYFKSIELGDQNLNIHLEKPQEYWRIFLILALFFLLLEMVLLKFLR